MTTDEDDQQRIRRLVTLKGGEYFFMPSLPFLRSLVMARRSA